MEPSTHARKISQFFIDNYNIKLSDRWIMDCIEWLTTSLPPSSQNPQTLLPIVHEQWVCCDIGDSTQPSLPHPENREDFLVGVFPLQVKSVFDISRSFYSQCHSIEEEEGEFPQGTQKKQIFLRLTDGAREVRAVECESIDRLTVDVAPGSKVIVSGRVLCRSGILMLRRTNLQILENSTRCTSYDYKTFLRHFLTTGKEMEFKAEKVEHQFDASIYEMFTEFGEQDGMCDHFEAIQEELYFGADNSDVDVAGELQFSPCDHVEMSEDGLNFDANNGDFEVANQIQLSPFGQVANIEDDLNCGNSTDEVAQFPFSYISHVNQSGVVEGEYTFRCIVITLLGNLSKNEGRRWSLEVRINDGTGTLDCEMGNNVLGGLIEFSAEWAHSQGRTPEGRNAVGKVGLVRPGFRRVSEEDLRFYGAHGRPLWGGEARRGECSSCR